MQQPGQNAIQLLDTHCIDHIAAGEVVERPASVVKELLENSLDAGATQITIDLQGGGLTLISVADNGCGMAPADAQLCTQRHATSKLRCPADLQRIATLGFRGEALSSVGAISELCITTRQADDETGYCVKLRGGKALYSGAAAAARGTCVTVRDLFYNTPARRKFMRAPATEQAHTLEAVGRVMLGARHAGVVLRSESRCLLDVAAEASGPQRVAAVLKPKLRTIRAFLARDDAANLRVSGYLGVPELERAEAKSIWLFVNGRFVRDRMLLRAVTAATQGRAGPKSSIAVVLFVDMDPATVDVNVHPQKTEVRFADAHAVYRVVTQALGSGLVQAADLFAAQVPSGPRVPVCDAPASATPDSERGGRSHTPNAGGGQPVLRQEPVAKASRSASVAGGAPHSDDLAAASRPVVGRLTQCGPEDSGARPAVCSPQVGRFVDSTSTSDGGLLAGAARLPADPTGPAQQCLPTSPRSTATCLAILHGRYGICLLPSQQLLVLDYPRWSRARLHRELCATAKPLAQHTLLLPETFVAEPPVDTWLQAHGESLQAYGFAIEPVAPRCYAVKSVPLAVRHGPAAAMAVAAAQRAARADATAEAIWNAILAVPRPMPDRAALQAEVQDLDLRADAADLAEGLALLDTAALAELTHPGAAQRRLNISRLG
jgi:DNA mismatch repair protein MutL